MSETQLSTAYLLQQKMEEEEGQQLEPIEKRPKGQLWSTPLTVICVMFVLISLIAAYSAACGFYKLSQEQEVTTKRPRNKAERQIQELEKVAVEARNKYFPMLIYLEVVKLGMAGAFIFSTVLLIARIPMARNFVIGVCGAALFYHACALIIMILMMSETGTVFNSMMDDAFKGNAQVSQEQADKAREYVTNQFFGYFTIFVSVLFLVRLAFYGAIMAYLWSDEVKTIFGEDPLAKLADQEAANAAIDTTLPA